MQCHDDITSDLHSIQLERAVKIAAGEKVTQFSGDNFGYRTLVSCCSRTSLSPRSGRTVGSPWGEVLMQCPSPHY